MKIKQYLAMAVVMALSVAGSYAQGTVTFGNSSATAVIDGQTGVNSAANVYTAGLYYSLDLGASVNPDAPTDGLAIVGATTAVRANGVILGGTRTVAEASPGQMALVQVRVWEVQYASYADAVTAGGWVGSSNPLTVTLGGGALPAASLVAAGLNQFATSQVPEPSVIALGILGSIGGLVLIRRRK